jgi:hypothetical protein
MTGRKWLTVWALSAVGGAICALGVLALGVYGVIPLVAVLAVAARLSQRSTAVGGAFFGFGTTAAAVLIAAYTRCAAAGEGQAVCVAQDVTPALVMAFLGLFAGATITSMSLRARSQTLRP